MARDGPRKLSTLGIMSEQSNPVDSIPLKKRSEISRKDRMLNNNDKKSITQNTETSTKNKTRGRKKKKNKNTENKRISGNKSEQSEETDTGQEESQHRSRSRDKDTHNLSDQNQTQSKGSKSIKQQKGKTLLKVGQQGKQKSQSRHTNNSKDIRRISISIPADEITKLRNNIAAKQFDLVNDSSSPEQDFGIYSRNQTISMIRRGSGQGKKGKRHIDFMGTGKGTSQQEHGHSNSGNNQPSLNISNRAQLGTRSKIGAPMVRAGTTQNQIMRGIIEEEGTHSKFKYSI